MIPGLKIKPEIVHIIQGIAVVAAAVAKQNDLIGIIFAIVFSCSYFVLMISRFFLLNLLAQTFL